MVALRQCAFDAPAKTKARLYGVTGKPQLFCPFREGLRPALIRQDMVARLVTGLLFIRSPAAVLRTVWTVIVDAVNRVIRRWIAHIGKENLEGFLPALADRYASPTVLRPLLVARIEAAREHSSPCGVCPGVATVTCGTVPREGGSGHFLAKAPARLGVVHGQG